MTYVNPTLTIPDAKIDGQTVTGKFVFPTNVRYEIGAEVDPVIQDSGTIRAISSLVLDYLEGDDDVSLGESNRQQLSLDKGLGLHTVTLDFQGYTGSPHQWGDTGNGGTTTDATSEDIHAQVSVLDRYLMKTEIDSGNPATLEIAEYSEPGRYEPLSVVVRDPNFTFDSVEESSVWDGSMTFVETLDIESYTSGTPQSPQ
ncbi:hypothetical protein G9C85_02640 [Halorubellus sp. JP-L1]|uniref:hypothetical protein n=1 Tax=Halorubellus sp. JP-L1 TaxID=2715753 RepID=UPI001408B7F9|nr:hypothetical protein [Halorubellus sp. JP-L1]NHN40536.1 hypothetical protein [Halorubellus sp. JP-L1]